MAQTRRVMITVPDNLLQELDRIVKSDKLNRSQLIREAVKLYLGERYKNQQRILNREWMQRGYMEMAEINLTLANEAISAENEAASVTEQMVCGA
ncbi:CopG family ribbon-helix-helix protein [Anaerobranca gottschalkii]|uniref:CopG family transcriptional regulator / antitoxin EndoAI n=1 Tax=Anaerobranca gottschalkii DSM 13577 TaxID=1120990 RepID=A0A1H9ZNM8_9FIRM|nr:ribbon-helix-helix protein, CopG family [Anaerobranca gottschalkii]SES82941.1 CopG family transcriptional regulator / antitoxin EndoAI [Anaerobranca gottschalkii DSM 13577]